VLSDDRLTAAFDSNIIAQWANPAHGRDHEVRGFDGPPCPWHELIKKRSASHRLLGHPLDHERRTGHLLDPDLRLWIPCHWLDSPHSWLIDAGENPKAVMHRLGQADLRTTARYVHVLDETGESAARRFEGLLPPL
jgi:hypothetical protein